MNTKTEPAIEMRRITVRYYGCVKCQKEHSEDDGKIFDDHHYWQSKHGIRQRVDNSRFVPRNHPRAFWC